MRVCLSPECGILGISIGDLTSKITLLLLTLVGDCKRYTEYYWLFYSANQESKWLILILLQRLWYWTKKDTYHAILYWNMFIISYLTWMFLICHLSSFYQKIWFNILMSFMSQFLKQSNNYIKFISKFLSTPESMTK